MSQFQKDLIVVLAVTVGVIAIIVGVNAFTNSKKADNRDYTIPASEAMDQTTETEEDVEVLCCDYDEDYASADIAMSEVKTADDVNSTDGLKDYSEWVCNTRLTDADLNGMPKSELRILRNTIYARHGYIFKSADLREYFSKFDWYTPSTSEVADLSSIEQHNVALIQRYE